MSYLEAGKARARRGNAPRPDGCGRSARTSGRGGVFGQYGGMAEEFGPLRIVGCADLRGRDHGLRGGRRAGRHPPGGGDALLADFALCAVDELVNQAAKARYMFGGQGGVPLVVREPMGMWRSSAAQHSQSLEAWYVHIPGLTVVAPATPGDNLRLLKAAIRSNDPVVYMEHKDLWGLEEELDEDEPPGALGAARVVCKGGDATVVSWSAMVRNAHAAAEALAEEGVSVEVIDLRTLWPWDREAVLASVRKTGRLVVAHEAVSVGGFGAEVAATVSEALFGSLKAPVKRLGAPRVPIPYAKPLEDMLRIGPDAIAAAVRAQL